MFEQEFDKLEEAFSMSTVMNVDEFRRLYYGRQDLFATFTDDGKMDIDHDIDAPAGYISYTINDVVARKVKTHEFYANVFRVTKNRSSRRFIEDIKTYDTRQLADDLIVIRSLNDIFSEQLIEDTIEKSMVKSILKSNFQKLWDITKTLAKTKGSAYQFIWRRIFMRLGYNGISDLSGTGILVKKREPVTIVFDTRVEELDIVPIQKSRRDQRRRIVDQVDRHVKRLATARNRVAKERFVSRA